jgi:hypothetical protein
VAFADWDVAFRTALGFPGRGSDAVAAGAAGSGRLLAIDELPYLLDHSPEIPSVLQELYDEAQNDRHYPPCKVIVCGSALSIMSELLSGSQPLRARAQLDLRINAFDYREAAAYWQIGDPEVALRIDAVFGGTPGYRALVQSEPPASVKGLAAWLGTNVLNPSHALFTETDYLLRETPSRALLEERDVKAAWEQSSDAFSSGVLGPHFERICAVWTQRYSGSRFGDELGSVGPAVINDAEGNAQHQLDVVGIQRGRRQNNKPPNVLVLGEAKSSNRPRTLVDLDRLDHIQGLLRKRAVPVDGAHLVLFGRSGFDATVMQAAADRPEVHLITLAELYA